MSMRFSIRGGTVIRRELERLLDAYPEAMGAAIYQEGLAIEADAKARTPVDTGRLRASAFVTPPKRGEITQVMVRYPDSGPGESSILSVIATGDRRRVSVQVGYATDYAPYVHENLEAHHAVGEAKFLENAVNARTAGFAERVAANTKRLAEAGVGVK